MPNRLVDLKAAEVSLVAGPAVRRRFLLTKAEQPEAAGEIDELAVLDAVYQWRAGELPASALLALLRDLPPVEADGADDQL